MTVTISQYRKHMRNPYAWPGGYEIRPVMTDGAVLCRACLITERRNILEALADPSYRTGWEIACFDVLWEGSSELCGHCSTEIKTEYGDQDN